MKRSLRRLTAALLCLVLLMNLVACGSKDNGVQQADSSNEFRKRKLDFCDFFDNI